MRQPAVIRGAAVPVRASAHTRSHRRRRHGSALVRNMARRKRTSARYACRVVPAAQASVACCCISASATAVRQASHRLRPPHGRHPPRAASTHRTARDDSKRAFATRRLLTASGICGSRFGARKRDRDAATPVRRLFDTVCIGRLSIAVRFHRGRGIGAPRNNMRFTFAPMQRRFGRCCRLLATCPSPVVAAP